MLERLKNMRHPGLRNIKTAIAVVVCLVLYRFVNREGAAFALIAAVICMQGSVDKSKQLGFDRIRGTFMGGIFGSIFAYFGIPGLPFPLFILCTFAGVVLFIYICNLTDSKSSIDIGCAVFLIIIADSSNSEQPVLYAFNRTLDTLIGAVIALLVNQLIFRPKPEQFIGEETVNPVFHYKHTCSGNHKTVKWRCGEIEELYIYPEQAIYQDLDFDFRLSVTKSTDAHSIASEFPGYTRQLMLLEGDLSLSHKEHHSVRLTPFETDIFKGAWETTSVGQSVELNLILAEDYSGELQPVFGGNRYTLKNDHCTAFYIVADNVKLSFRNGGKEYSESLSKGDFVIVSWFENGSEEYTARFLNTDTQMITAVKIECMKR